MKRILFTCGLLIGLVMASAVVVQARSNNEPPDAHGNRMLVSKGVGHGSKEPEARLGRSGEQLSVVENGRLCCVVDPGGSGPCATADVVARGASIEVVVCETDLSPNKIRVFGSVPPNGTGVEVVYDDGSRFPGEIGNGSFIVEPVAPSVKRSVPEVVYATTSGEVSVPVPAPDEVLLQGCNA